MEDHRNWMDASYKTYVRPLALPWPYTLKKGEKISQSVTLKLEGSAAKGKRARRALPRSKCPIGAPTGKELPRDRACRAGRWHRGSDRQCGSHQEGSAVVPRLPFRSARRATTRQTMRKFAELGAKRPARSWCWRLSSRASMPRASQAPRSPSCSATWQRSGQPPRPVEQSSRGSPSRPRPTLAAPCRARYFRPLQAGRKSIAAARKAFPGVPVGGGMFSYFTELNRKRPPAGLLDFIVHTGLPIVHAGDDVSMTETLEGDALDLQVRAGFRGWQALLGLSDRGRHAAEPLWRRARRKPERYPPGDEPRRSARARTYRRGVVRRLSSRGRLRAASTPSTLAATHGPSGIVYAKQPHAQPWFDEAEREGLSALSCDRRPCGAVGRRAGHDELGCPSGPGARRRRQRRHRPAPRQPDRFRSDDPHLRMRREVARRWSSTRRRSRRLAAIRTGAGMRPRPAVGETLTLKPYAIAEMRFA